MSIKLIKPTPVWKDKIMDYKAEFISNRDSLDGTALLGDYETFEEWYNDLCRNSSEETVADGWVPSTTLLAINDENKLIGMIDIRHRLNDYLLKFGGHIGYSVRKSERRKGYATQMLSMALKIAKNMNIDRVMVSCKKNNVASAAVILKNGGVLENEVIENGEILQRYWINI